MKLKVRRRKGTFSSHINGRAEGSGDGKVPAADISVSYFGTKSDIDNIVPLLNGEKFSEVMYDENGKFLCPYMNPQKLHRRPEGLSITIYDQGKKNPLKFTEASAKNLEITYHDKRNCEVYMLLQVHPAVNQGDRLFRLIAMGEAEFEIEAGQEEFFFDKEEGEEDEGDQGGDEAQQELPDEESESEEAQEE